MFNQSALANTGDMSSELQRRMAAAQQEMANLQKIEAEMKKQEKEFHVRMDGLRQKLESASKAHSAAEVRKAKLEKERARIDQELLETDKELVKQAALKQEITKSIVNMQELAMANKQENVSEKLAQPAAAKPAPTSSGFGGMMGGLAASWMGSSPAVATTAASPQVMQNTPRNPTAPPLAAPDLLGDFDAQPPVACAAPPSDLLGGLGGMGATPSAVPSNDLLGGFSSCSSTPPPPPPPPPDDVFGGFGGFDAIPPAGMGAPPASRAQGGTAPPTDPFANLMM